VRELIRQGAQLALSAPADWLGEIDDATLSSAGEAANDPVLVAAVRRSNRAYLVHWATANLRAPGERVEPNLSEDALSVARDLVRHGVGETALDAYRTGQNAAWVRWMSMAFELTSDVDELRELLDVTARSIGSFLDATIAAISARMLEERAELTHGTHAERRETVTLILEGAPIPEHVAAQRLGYGLDGPHRAAIVWSEVHDTQLGTLEAVAGALASRPMTVIANTGTLWVWGPSADAPDDARLAAALRTHAGVRVALGSVKAGVEGFRRSHFEAVTAQRMVARMGSHQHIVRFEEVRLVSLVTQDAAAADQFVRDTLGVLATASVELKRALLTYLQQGCNASAAAKRLRTHRNTLLRRLAAAEALLPGPLAEHRTEVAVALQILRWRG
jgi:DNA-binding PucR family transcriptional regulator